MNRLCRQFAESLGRIARIDAAADWVSDDAPAGPILSLARQRGAEEEHIQLAMAEVASVATESQVATLPASARFLEQIPIAFARQHVMLGLAGGNGNLIVAVASLEDWTPLDVIGRYLGQPVTPVLAPRKDILTAINLAYQQRVGQAQQVIGQLDRKTVLHEVEQLHSHDDLLDVASRAPVIRVVNLLLFEAVKQLASDVHIQPYDDQLVVRFRIDGVLFDAFKLPRALLDEVISRIKVMGRMNIAERRLAQDGRATVQVGDRVVDLRIASMPTSHGERIVIRLLDKSARLYTLEELGMNERTLVRFREAIGIEHGLILVTGPTGSGKSTTLYAALQELNSQEMNVLTLEDPIEYQLPGISQTQVSDKKGMTFASGLRHVLRQDPDIIMVGEIRDHETAVMAIQSALTGHLVFSTLHTNDAASAVTRLLDLGIEPYLVASSLVGVLAQRLVRCNCTHCRETRPPTADQLQAMGLTMEDLPGGVLWQGVGCAQCRQTGYSGRVGIFELLTVDEPVRQQIQNRGTASQIKAAAMQAGMLSLRESGIARILAGITTYSELQRVSMRST